MEVSAHELKHIGEDHGLWGSNNNIIKSAGKTLAGDDESNPFDHSINHRTINYLPKILILFEGAAHIKIFASYKIQIRKLKLPEILF